MKKRGLLTWIFLAVFFAGFASAASITTNNLSSTIVLASIAGASNLYSYEVNYNLTGTASSVDFYNFLSDAGDGSDTANGYSIRGNVLSVYESRLDNTKAGKSGTDDLFNITYSGSLALSSLVSVSADGTETTTTYNTDGTTIVTVTTVVSSGGGGGTTVQHYSIKILSPGDVTLPKEGVIKVPITIQNPGNVALKRISLSANVTFNSVLSNDIQISLEKTQIAEIPAGSSEQMLVTINANTKKAGIYKVTITANVGEPAFTDWGEFYIEFKKTTESDAGTGITALESLLSQNPECFELTEMANEAKILMDQRDFTKVAAKVQEATDACQRAITLSKQKSSGIKADEKIIYYSIIATAATLLILVIFYAFRKIKYRKSKGNYS